MHLKLKTIYPVLLKMKLQTWGQILIGCKSGFNVLASIVGGPDLKKVLMKSRNTT